MMERRWNQREYGNQGKNNYITACHRYVWNYAWKEDVWMRKMHLRMLYEMRKGNGKKGSFKYRVRARMVWDK